MVRALVARLLEPFRCRLIPCVLPTLSQPLNPPTLCLEPVVKLLRFQLVDRVGRAPDAVLRRRSEIDPPHVVAFVM